MARRRRTSTKTSVRTSTRTSVSGSGRWRSSKTVTLPGMSITWTVSQRPGRLPHVSVSTRQPGR
jgi:hypothetical protein